MELNRRKFLELSGAAAAASILGSVVSSSTAHATNQNFESAGGASPFGDPADRTLIVVDMEGGNDALNTLVPQSGTYHDQRPTIGLSDDEVLTFAGLDYGVNPALGQLQGLWDAGQMAAIYGVGLPAQTRSHFVAQDAWRSAQPGKPATSGWLGRWLEETAPRKDVALRAISLGGSTLAAEGETGRPVAIQSVDGYRLAPPRDNAAVTAAVLSMADPRAEGLFGEAQSAIPDTVESVDLLQALIADAASQDFEYGPDPSSSLFAAAQAIIQADVGAQLLYITVRGFDTHASQRVLQDQQLETVANGLAMVFEGLEQTGHAERTLALTVSEFGRRVAENASAGTDHGSGGLAMLMGPAVNSSQVVGGADLGNLVEGDLPVVVDARSVYENALTWLGASDQVIGDVVEGDWEPVELLETL